MHRRTRTKAWLAPLRAACVFTAVAACSMAVHAQTAVSAKAPEAEAGTSAALNLRQAIAAECWHVLHP